MGFRFVVKPSVTDEVIRKDQSPGANARRIAVEKATEVASRVRNGIVIGADTIVVIDRKVLGKPKSKSDAKRMLRLLSGREHSVFTGFALVDSRTKRKTAAVERTRVRFRQLEEEEIDAYVASGSPMDKSGAYGIQDDRGALFVEKVNGCFYTVVGFPLARFHTTFRKFVRELSHSSGKHGRNGKKD